MTIHYAREDGVSVDEFRSVLERSGLAARRPVDAPDRLAAMVANAGLTVVARDGQGLLVGIARSVTDFAYCCYLSDLAVDVAVQGQGVGRELIARTRAELHPQANLLLLSAPGAVGFYEGLGLTRHGDCFLVR